jgi:hypothetical protein
MDTNLYATLEVLLLALLLAATKTTVLALSGESLPTLLTETSQPRPSETTLGTHTEELNTKPTISLGSLLLNSPWLTTNTTPTPPPPVLKETKPMELEPSGSLLLTPNGVTFPARPKETTAGSLMEEKNTPQTASPGSTFPDTKLFAILDLLHQTPLPPETKPMELELSGPPLLTLLKETFPARPSETTAGTLTEELNTAPTTSLGSALKTNKSHK